MPLNRAIGHSTTLGFLCWLATSLSLVAFFVLSPSLFTQLPHGMRLGTDITVDLPVDPGARMTAQEVAALPDAAFTALREPLNKGYTHDVYWLRVPAVAATSGSAWLEILPTYLDRVTLYQLEDGAWRSRSSGDTVAMADRVPVRQLMFRLRPDLPFLLRVQTTSPMQLDGTVWRDEGLMAHLSATEWASGVHQGINLMHALLIIGAALALRMRSLAAMAVASVAALVHGAADRGYLQVWLPAQWAHWGDVAVSIGTLVLPAALSWQFREVLTRGTRWRRADRLMWAIGVAPLLCLISIPLGRYSDWAWVGVVAPWALSAVMAVVAWRNLLREGATLVNVMLVLPGTANGVTGLYATAAYAGLAEVPRVEISVLWQLNMLLINIMVTVAVGAGLIRRYTESMRELARSEQELDERVRQRTAELLQA